MSHPELPLHYVGSKFGMTHVFLVGGRLGADVEKVLGRKAKNCSNFAR